jgi:hypothetical protein
VHRHESPAHRPGPPPFPVPPPRGLGFHGRDRGLHLFLRGASPHALSRHGRLRDHPPRQASSLGSPATHPCSEASCLATAMGRPDPPGTAPDGRWKTRLTRRKGPGVSEETPEPRRASRLTRQAPQRPRGHARCRGKRLLPGGGRPRSPGGSPASLTRSLAFRVRRLALRGEVRRSSAPDRVVNLPPASPPSQTAGPSGVRPSSEKERKACLRGLHQHGGSPGGFRGRLRQPLFWLGS